MDIKEAYLIMQKNCGIKVGDTVKVLRKAEQYEMGWDSTWVKEMDETIGKTFVVREINWFGVSLNDLHFTFPVCVLKKVDPAEHEFEFDAFIIKNDNGKIYSGEGRIDRPYVYNENDPKLLEIDEYFVPVKVTIKEKV